MNIEITDLEMILDYLETTSLEPHDDYTSEFTYKDQKILYKYIKQLQQENTQLKQQLKDKDEKISNVKDIITTMQSNFIDNNACFVDYDDYLWELKNILEILETNKED